MQNFCARVEFRKEQIKDYILLLQLMRNSGVIELTEEDIQKEEKTVKDSVSGVVFRVVLHGEGELKSFIEAMNEERLFNYRWDVTNGTYSNEFERWLEKKTMEDVVIVSE